MSFLYYREAIGINCSSISIAKIRTMVEDADSLYTNLCVANGLDSHGKVINDPRVTPLGRILRRYWVDEVPQLYNLFNRDLKLVGIRPMRKVDWRNYPDDVRRRAMMQRPGLMGIQYAFPRSSKLEVQIENMRKYLDEYYLDPFGTDLKYFRMISRAILIDGVRSK